MTRKVCSIDDNGSGGGAGGGQTRSNSARSKPNQNGRIKVESIPLRPIRMKNQENSPLDSRCILVVGTSGTGKTTLLNIFTGANEVTGSGAQGVTSETVIVPDSIHSNYPQWIDNPGWSDPGGKSDSHVFKDLLRTMQDLGIYNLQAVIWCVTPQPRMDANLQAQARFIHEFTEENEKKKIWNNVIIVSKGKVHKNLDEDCQGARTAATSLWVHAQPICLGWELATPEIVQGTEPKLRKETLRIFTEEEIRAAMEAAIDSLPPPIQVVFANQKCLSCGQTGDPRLMEDKCHRGKKQGHTGALEQRFSKKEVGVAVAGGAVGIGALSAVAIATGGAEALAALPIFVAPSSILAGHRFFNTSSTNPPPCGPVRINDMRWNCCGQPEVGGKGCTDMCDLCDKIWGEGPGCVLIRNPDRGLQGQMNTYEVHVKNHDLVQNEVPTHNKKT